MRALLAAFVVLVGISSTDAAACLSTNFIATVSTCDCPAGTGPTNSYSVALPVIPSATGYGLASGDDAAQLAALNVALALCVDLHPGYKMAAVVTRVLPTACVIGDGYCPGYKTAFNTGDKVILATGTVGAYAATTTGNYVHSATTDFIQRTAAIACPTNTANTGQAAPYTIDKCKVTAGYYVSTAAAAAQTPVVSQCTLGDFCSTGTNAGSVVETPASCIDAVNVVLTAAAYSGGGFSCPLGTYGTMGTTLAASIAGLTGEVVCGDGRGPDADSDACLVSDGYYGAEVVTTAAATACPTGLTGTAAATLASACTGIKPGYEVITAIPASPSGSEPSITALLAGITPCRADRFCAGAASAVTFTGLSAPLLTHTAVSVAAAATCPLGSGNAITGAAAQGVNAVSRKTGCIDLLVDYAFKAAGTGTTLTGLIGKCTGVDKYGCGGSAGIFVDYTQAANTLDLEAVGFTTGQTDLSFASDTAVVTTATVDSAANAATRGSTLVNLACPTGSTNTAFGVFIASCLLEPGYYIDHSSLLVPATCTANKYCPGGGPVGAAGGLLNCPAGSVAPTTAGILNSNIDACTVSENFYIAAGTLTVPAACPTASICAGGGAVGTAGGSVVCPTDSTLAACVSSTTTTTVNLTPASQPITVDVAAPTAAGSPAVTVTNTVPSASSAASTVASMVVVTVAAMVAL